MHFLYNQPSILISPRIPFINFSVNVKGPKRVQIIHICRVAINNYKLIETGS